MNDLTTCLEPSCSEPRKTYPSGRVATRCSRHESLRVAPYQRRRIEDPDNPGQTIAISTLYNRRHWRRVAERMVAERLAAEA